MRALATPIALSCRITDARCACASGIDMTHAHVSFHAKPDGADAIVHSDVADLKSG